MFDEHPELSQLQEKLARQVEIPSDRGYEAKPGHTVLALDIQYKGDRAHIAGDVFTWGQEGYKTYGGVITADVPYVPSYFCFREGPPLLALIERLRGKFSIELDLIVVDGHGIAHPRLFGVGCWIGLATGVPTIGSAKEPLVRHEGDLAEERGSTLPVLVEGKLVGHVLRRQKGINPVYASPGHLVTIDEATRIVLEMPGEYKIPDPIRRADHVARAHAKEEEGDYMDLGELVEIKPLWERE